MVTKVLARGSTLNVAWIPSSNPGCGTNSEPMTDEVPLLLRYRSLGTNRCRSGPNYDSQQPCMFCLSFVQPGTLRDCRLSPSCWRWEWRQFFQGHARIPLRGSCGYHLTLMFLAQQAKKGLVLMIATVTDKPQGRRLLVENRARQGVSTT